MIPLHPNLSLFPNGQKFSSGFAYSLLWDGRGYSAVPVSELRHRTGHHSVADEESWKQSTGNNPHLRNVEDFYLHCKSVRHIPNVYVLQACMGPMLRQEYSSLTAVNPSHS